MSMQFNKNHQSISIIPKYRLQYIDLRLKWFMSAFNLKDRRWPLDCVALLEEIEATNIIPLLTIYTEFDPRVSKKLDAVTAFVPEGVEGDEGDEGAFYFMQINSAKTRYPFKCSRDCRLNFTIGTEIGHIVLGHLLIPRELKTAEEIEQHEKEADEFAGRLTMP